MSSLSSTPLISVLSSSPSLFLVTGRRNGSLRLSRPVFNPLRGFPGERAVLGWKSFNCAMPGDGSVSPGVCADVRVRDGRPVVASFLHFGKEN